VDDLAAHFLPNLEDMASTLAAIVENTANADFASEFVYDDTKGTFVVPNDMVNTAAVLDAAIVQSQVLPPAVSQTIQSVATDLKGQAEQLALADLTDPDLQNAALQVATAAVGMVISLDFFNENYPDGEAFLDQTFGTGNGVSSEPMPTVHLGLPTAQSLLVRPTNPLLCQQLMAQFLPRLFFRMGQ